MSHTKEYDLNHDGIVTEKELAMQELIYQLEAKIMKSSTQAKMAWISLFSMVLFTILILSPYINADKIVSINDLAGMFYVAQASIVGAYFGFTVWMNKN